MCIYILMCVPLSLYVCLCVCMSVGTYACMHACMHVCMYVCMLACMYVCQYVCMYTRARYKTNSQGQSKTQLLPCLVRPSALACDLFSLLQGSRPQPAGSLSLLALLNSCRLASARKCPRVPQHMPCPVPDWLGLEPKASKHPSMMLLSSKSPCRFSIWD